jgi:protein-disulfide isomerase
MIYVLLFRDGPSAGSGSPTPPTAASVPQEPVSLQGAWLEGARNAPVVVIQYSDFECPYCRQFANGTLLDLRRTYVKRGDVLLAFRHLPLRAIHPLAYPAARAAECAGRQGRFWEMHDWLFRDGRSLKDALSPKALAATGMVADCSQASALIDAKIAEDVAGARALQVTGTPVFFVGIVRPDGQVKVLRRLSGTLSLQEFSDVLDPLLPFSSREPATK